MQKTHLIVESLKMFNLLLDRAKENNLNYVEDSLVLLVEKIKIFLETEYDMAFPYESDKVAISYIKKLNKKYKVDCDFEINFKELTTIVFDYKKLKNIIVNEETAFCNHRRFLRSFRKLFNIIYFLEIKNSYKYTKFINKILGKEREV